MQIKEFEKMKKKTEPKKMIFLHCIGEIYLTNKQLSEIIDLKNKEIKNEVRK